MKFNCDSIYVTNPTFNRLFFSNSKSDLHIEDSDDNETKDAQKFCEKFSEKWLQIQNSSSESEKKKLLCNFLKLESVFEFLMKLFEEGKSIRLWNVGLLFNEYNAKKYGALRGDIYKAYVSFVDNVFNGRFDDAFEKTMLYQCDDECEPLMWLLPNGWLDCWCYIIDENQKDFCINRYYDSDAVFAGEIVHPSNVDVNFFDFIKTEEHSKYMNEKFKNKNDQIFGLLEQLENGLIAEDDLSAEDLEKLCLLYEGKIQDVDDEIFALREKLKHQYLDDFAIILEEFAIENSKIHLGSSIRKDIGLDEDFEVMKLSMAIEEKYKIKTTEMEMKETYLIEDLINLIVDKQISAK